MIRLKLLLVLGGIALIVFGVQEIRLASKAEAEPHAISCADLGANGPGTNAHVTVTKFLACTQSFVYQSGRISKGQWKTVWVPLVPADGEYVKRLIAMVASGVNPNTPPPPPSDIRVLLKSSLINRQADLDSWNRAETITGLVTNTIESIGSKEKTILEDSYPGIDFGKCYILDHGASPPGPPRWRG